MSLRGLKAWLGRGAAEDEDETMVRDPNVQYSVPSLRCPTSRHQSDAPSAAAVSPHHASTRSTQAPIFYFFPPSMVEALLPTPRLNHQPEDEAAVAQVQMSEAHLADPSVPVFWILPKGLITTVFPPFTSPPEAFTAGHKALNYVASAALMVVICLTT